MKNKKGLSAIIATLMLILLTMVLVGIIWGVISNMVKNNIESTSCIDSLGKINLNDRYTCYNASSNETQFSINIEDISVDKVLVGISVAGQKRSLEITNENKVVSNLKPYGGSYGDVVILPGKNEGMTYVYNISGAGFSAQTPDSIEVAPVINGNKCDSSDSVVEVSGC